MDAKKTASCAERFRQLLEKDKRYDPEGYNFIYEALDWTLKNLAPRDKKRDASQHVTAYELCEGFRRYAIEQFGCLALCVLEYWGVKNTDDIGEMVFNLVDKELMGKQESDAKSEFHQVYDFTEVFSVKPVFVYDYTKKIWDATYMQKTA